MRLVTGIALSALVLGGCGVESPAPPPTDSLRDPIIGGAAETGWKPVGALTYFGQTFCSGTLIAPQWVLTAAHCVTGSDLPAKADIRFFIGDETPAGPGQYFFVGKLVPHPSYGAGNPQHDLGLVYLSTPVPGSVATPVVVNTQSLNGFVGTDVTYVGFGTNVGYNATIGAGVKRKAVLGIVQVDTNQYATESTSSTGICAGDSGGPGLYQFGGQWRAIGVNSSVAGGGAEPCLNGFSTQVRVDTHAAWVDTTVDTPVDCNTTPGACPCTQACQSDGSCDLSACPNLDCEGIAVCMESCADDACAMACYNQGSSDAQAQYLGLITCHNDFCASASDMQACLAANCQSEYVACLPPDDCDIAGGDCGTQACYPGFATELYCFDTAGKAPDAACSASATGLECVDGYVCINLGGGARCEHMCLDDNDCAVADHCEVPLFDGIDDIGVCLCDDADDDNSCAAVDCNDGDPAIKPGAPEVCGNGVDDDCDTQVDEGCALPDAGPDAAEDSGSPDGGSGGADSGTGGAGASAGDGGAAGSGAGGAAEGGAGGVAGSGAGGVDDAGVGGAAGAVAGGAGGGTAGTGPASGGSSGQSNAVAAEEASDGGGCGCSTRRSRTPGAAMAVLMALAALSGVRRRRRVSAP